MSSALFRYRIFQKHEAVPLRASGPWPRAVSLRGGHSSSHLPRDVLGPANSCWDKPIVWGLKPYVQEVREMRIQGTPYECLVSGRLRARQALILWTMSLKPCWTIRRRDPSRAQEAKA